MAPFSTWSLCSLVFGCITVSSYTVNAEVSCASNEECEKVYNGFVGRTRDGWEKTVLSMCLPTGTCSNPFHGGCLRLLGTTDEQRRRFRPCNSDDAYLRENQHLWNNTSTPNATNETLHNCELHPNEFSFPEFRIHNANWESSIFLSWVYQIMLSEVMGVATTVGLRTGETERSSFYSLENTMQYSSVAYPYKALERSNTLIDANCSKTAEECTNVLPEVWSPDFQPFVANATADPPIANGQVAKTAYYIPDFTARQHPSLAIHYGYKGEENRKMLAGIFKRPTTWLQYCEEVSNSSCTIPDETAKRPPKGSFEGEMYFSEGDYTGHFRATEKNDCSGEKATTCSGYFAAPPCAWNIYPDNQFHWNDVVGMESGEGPEPPNGGYSYDSMAEVWRAAHATKSHVMVGWYQPELLIQAFFDTDAAFQEVLFPPPTDICLAHRPTLDQRCSENIAERQGDKRGSCGNEIKTLIQLIASSVRQNNDQLEEAHKSPAFDFIKSIRISELDINRIFQKWLDQDGVDRYGNEARMAVCSWVVENYDKLMFSVPPGHPRQLDSTSQYEAWYVSLSQVFSILTAFIAILGMMLCVRYRETKVMVFAQPLFVLLILFGFLCVCTGAALLALEPTENICISVTWFIVLGYSVELIPVLVKTSAINKLIQSSKKAKKVNINRRGLILDVTVTTTMVCIFLICWTVIDPPGRKEVRRISIDDPTVVEADLRCSSEEPYWRLAAFAWEILLLVMAAVLAFQSRDVLKEFNESSALGMMVYTHFLFVVVRMIFQILYLGGTFPYALIASLLSFGYSLDALVSMCIYVFPKFEEARKNPVSYKKSKLNKRSSAWKSTTNLQEEEDLKLLVCTANIGNAEPTQESMEAWIPLRGSCKVVTNLDDKRMRAGNFDMIVIGMQESTWNETASSRQQSKKEVSEEDILNAMENHSTALLREMLQDILGEGYSEVAEDQRGQMRLWIWASNDVVDKITDVKVSGANTGIGNVMANKGGIVITVTYKTTRISFLSAHLAAHEGDVYYKARCDNLKVILRESKTFWSSKLDASISSHHMFVMGDLNFRTRFDGDGKHEDHFNRAMHMIDFKDWGGLYEYDELQLGLAKGDMLVGFETPQCNFAPTFKVQRESGFVYKDQRVPSFTDRILFKSSPGLNANLKTLAYEPCVDFITSDHKPIRGAFSIVPNDVSGAAIKDVDIRLTFHSMECFGLPAADSNGYSDPYLLFLWDSVNLVPTKRSFKDKIRKLVAGTSWPRTRYIAKTLNPKWGAESVELFAKNITVESHAMLWVAAMDADLLALKDDFLGAVALNIQDIMSTKTGDTEKVVQVDQNLLRGGKISGRIKFQVDVELNHRRPMFAPLRMDDDVL